VFKSYNICFAALVLQEQLIKNKREYFFKVSLPWEPVKGTSSLGKLLIIQTLFPVQGMKSIRNSFIQIIHSVDENLEGCLLDEVNLGWVSEYYFGGKRIIFWSQKEDTQTSNPEHSSSVIPNPLQTVASNIRRSKPLPAPPSKKPASIPSTPPLPEKSTVTPLQTPPSSTETQSVSNNTQELLEPASILVASTKIQSLSNNTQDPLKPASIPNKTPTLLEKSTVTPLQTPPSFAETESVSNNTQDPLKPPPVGTRSGPKITQDPLQLPPDFKARFSPDVCQALHQLVLAVSDSGPLNAILDPNVPTTSVAVSIDLSKYRLKVGKAAGISRKEYLDINTDQVIACKFDEGVI